VSPKHIAPSGGVLTCARPWLHNPWIGGRRAGATLHGSQHPWATALGPLKEALWYRCVAKHILNEVSPKHMKRQIHDIGRKNMDLLSKMISTWSIKRGLVVPMCRQTHTQRSVSPKHMKRKIHDIGRKNMDALLKAVKLHFLNRVDPRCTPTVLFMTNSRNGGRGLGACLHVGLCLACCAWCLLALLVGGRLAMCRGIAKHQLTKECAISGGRTLFPAAAAARGSLALGNCSIGAKSQNVIHKWGEKSVSSCSSGLSQTSPGNCSIGAFQTIAIAKTIQTN